LITHIEHILAQVQLYQRTGIPAPTQPEIVDTINLRIAALGGTKPMKGKESFSVVATRTHVPKDKFQRDALQWYPPPPPTHTHTHTYTHTYMLTVEFTTLQSVFVVPVTLISSPSAYFQVGCR
jgi:hypothetical protein